MTNVCIVLFWLSVASIVAATVNGLVSAFLKPNWFKSPAAHELAMRDIGWTIAAALLAIAAR